MGSGGGLEARSYKPEGYNAADQRSDTSFLVGVRYGRESERARLLPRVEAAEAAVEALEMALSYEREGNRFCRICSDHDARGAK